MNGGIIHKCPAPIVKEREGKVWVAAVARLITAGRKEGPR